MTHDIIDNRQSKLLDRIKEILPGSQLARFAVGYFFLSGLTAIEAELRNIQELRLLIGNTTNRETLEQIAEGYHRLDQIAHINEAISYPRRSQIVNMVETTVQNIGQSIAAMPQTDESEALVSTLIELIVTGKLKVRVYTKGRLHAKAYIFDYGPIYTQSGELIPRAEKGIAIVGSSNFTLSGISHNTELNVMVHGNANHEELTNWFEALWNEADDFDPLLMQELERSWAQAEVTPYEIYLKTLYELIKDRLDSDEDTSLANADEITASLTEFQAQAVRRAVRMIRQYGGCFISDVVGLGKSYIGAAIIKHFERTERARSLIICPAPLVEMWERYNEVYQLNARVLSIGMLREESNNGLPLLMSDVRYRDRDFVLVDESHNFRNANTQRYRVLEAFLAQGRKCVLLTATPRNRSITDIYNQLKLFHQSDQTLIPIDPPNLRQYFQLVEEGQRSLPGLLANILIRRTRNHILRWYGYDAETHEPIDPSHFDQYRAGARKAYIWVKGTPNYFPRRELHTVEYSIEETYQGLYQQLRRHLESPSDHPTSTYDFHGLCYARYGLWNYVRRGKQNQPPYADLQRAGANLRGLMRVSMFKRLESSVYAFRQTLKRQINIHDTFLQALGAGIIAAGEEAQNILYESDRYEEDLLAEALRRVSGRYEAADFDCRKLRQDMENDRTILAQMLEIVEEITPEKDAKLQMLIEILRHPPLDSGKCLIFTQYADTARYLDDNLVEAGLGRRVAVIYSDSTSKSSVVGRFAPRSNPEYVTQNQEEIDLLVATDVLSEGLNLQDCDKVINYDLHWNPVRLIQRFGRIDRIGSDHQVIFAFNFLPETALDQHLGLREKLASRIQEIHQTIGEDSAVLDPTEQLNEEAMYAIYAARDIGRYEDGSDEMLDLDEAEEIIRQIKRDNPGLFQRITELRDGVRTGRETSDFATFVFCRAGKYQRLFLLDQEGEIVSREIPFILKKLKCEPDEPSKALPHGYNRVIASIFDEFETEVRNRQAEQSRVEELSRGQKHVLRELRVMFGIATTEERRALIQLLERGFGQSLPRMIQSHLNDLSSQKLDDEAMLTALKEIYDKYALGGGHASKENGLIRAEAARIICSEALLVKSRSL